MLIEQEKMEKILGRLPKEESNLDDWIREECVIPAFIIYNSKEDTAVCTRCGRTNFNGRLFTGRHGERIRCPECEAEVELLSEGRGRAGRSDFFRLLTWSRKGKTVYGRLYEIEASFEKPGPPALKKWLSALYIVNAKERSYYKHKPECFYGPECWEKYKTFKIPAPPGGMGYCWTTKYTFTYMKVHGLEDVFLKSDLKYLWIPGWCNNMPPEEMVQYIGYGIRQQSIELMVKAGFTNLVIERLKGRKNGHIVNWQGKSLERILRLPKRHVRRMQQLNPCTRDLLTFRKMTEEEREAVSALMLEELSSYVGYGDMDRLREKVGKLTPYIKWLKYMDTQVTDRTGIREWFDYIGACEKLGRDIHKNRILFPEDLKEAHDRAIEDVAAKEDNDRTAAIRAKARVEEFQTDRLMILPGDTQEKLNIESAVLHHCVKTYGDQIARGKCWIWFVRTVEDKDTPFYTLETDLEGNIKQCRGMYNKSMTEDVEQFVHQFAMHLQKEIKKERTA